MRIYRDRVDAAAKLLEAMPRVARDEKAVVLALPRGGVPLGAVIARELGLPLDIILVRKLGAPGNPELALGAVTGPGEEGLVINERLARAYDVTKEDVAGIAAPQLAEIARRRRAWLGDRRPVPVKGRTAIVVDDGMATGATMEAALKALRARGPKRVIVAVPVASADALDRLRGAADEIVCPVPHLRLGAVGGAYVSFPQVSDAEVGALLDRTAAGSSSSSSSAAADR